MYDPKFEKGVRQKMEGLEFIPPESVWVNIEKAVAGKRRRRVAFYFWRFALPGLLLAGAVGIGYLTTRPVTPAATNAPHPAVAVKATPATTTPASTTPADPTLAAKNPATTTSPTTTAASTTPTATTDITTIASTTPARAHSIGTTAPHTNTPQSTTTHRSPGRRLRAAGKPETAMARPELTTGKPEPTIGKPAADDAVSRDAAANTPTAAATSPAPYLYQPNLVGQRDVATIHAASLSAKKTTIALHTLEKKKRPWEAGFTGGIGISRLNRLNITQTSSPSYSSNAFVNINSATASNDKHYVSDVRPALSYTGGIYLQKPLSDRWILNLGMNLHFYSTRITVGQPVSSYVPSTLSLIAATATTSVQSTSTYTAGDDEVITNHYYFLEVPVGIQFKVNKSKMLPVFLEGGVSLSRLMGANALFYNSHSGVYYKDESVLQKTQFNLYSALMVGLPFHGVHIEVGPQLQYGLTPLVNNSSLGDQHFLYTGIRFIVMPGK